jgi:signal transduction histidine kinase
MRKSIYIRNFFTTASIVLLSFLILGGMFFYASYVLVISEKQKAMSSTADDVVSYVRYISMTSYQFKFDNDALKKTLTAFSSMSGFDILITDRSGTIVTCSDELDANKQLGKTVPSDILSKTKTSYYYGKDTDLGGVYKEIRYVMSVPLITGVGSYNIGYLFLSSDSNSMVQIWRQFAGIFLLLSAIVLALTFVISYITTKKQAEPINEMALAARRFARGEYNIRVENTGRIDEIGQLTDAFNTMAASIESSENNRREFIANVSHELKTPMTVISGFSDGILDGTIPHETEQKYLEIISSETKRLSRLVRNMLDMSRIQSTSTETLLCKSFDISEVIRLSLLSLGGKIDAKTLDVGTELPEEAIMTRGDKDSITQVVYNLIDNAIKFAHSGSWVRLSLWKQGHKAFVSVENEGEAIPPNEIPFIFDRFHKADHSRSENREGVGLGLYIVKTILDNHNEDINVTSSGGITKFTFTLTLAGH